MSKDDPVVRRGSCGNDPKDPMSGQRRGGGSPTECFCPQCGTLVPHRRGIPCREVKCPQCGSFMMRKG